MNWTLVGQGQLKGWVIFTIESDIAVGARERPRIPCASRRSSRRHCRQTWQWCRGDQDAPNSRQEWRARWHASVRIALLNGRIGFSLRQIEHVTGERLVRGDRNTGRLRRQALACSRVTSVFPSRKKSTSFGGSVSSVGALISSPGRAGRTMCGVTMMTRSVSFFWYDSRRTTTPSTGTLPSQGSCSIAFLPSLCSSPPITKLWPSRSSTVVEARRTISAGTEMPLLTVTV